MQHAATTWEDAPADNRLAELMKAFGGTDAIAPVDLEYFGRRVGELLTRAAFGNEAGVFLTRVVSEEQHVPENVLKIDRVRPGGPPRVRMPSMQAPIITLKRYAAR
jgi:hypothetical protein